MKKKIVIINGSGGVGKDTFIQFCQDHIDAISISSVDRIKEASRILGWNGGKSDVDRKFLSDMKLLCSKYNNGPFEYVKESIIQFIGEEGIKVIFIHIREPLEIQKVVDEFDCSTVLITNNNASTITSNIADGNVYDYTYDHIISNSGSLESLKRKAKEFVAKLAD